MFGKITSLLNNDNHFTVNIFLTANKSLFPEGNGDLNKRRILAWPSGSSGWLSWLECQLIELETRVRILVQVRFLLNYNYTTCQMVILKAKFSLRSCTSNGVVYSLWAILESWNTNFKMRMFYW